MTSQQKRRLLQAKVAAVLQHELGQVPSTKQIEEVALLARVLSTAVLGVHDQRREQKAAGQLPIF